LPPKRTRQSNIRSTNVNFPSASIPSSTVNVIASSDAAFLPPSYPSIISQASAIVVPYPAVPAVIPSETTHVPITIPPIATLVPHINSVPVITSPADSISRNENNNEFVDEILNLLTNNQHDGAADNFNNNQTLIRQETGINVVRPRGRINRTEMFSELEANPRRRAIFEIISRYYNSSIVSYSIVNRLYNLEAGDMITLSSLIYSSPSTDRPEKTSQLSMIEELTASDMFVISRPKQNIIQIRKNTNYLPQS